MLEKTNLCHTCRMELLPFIDEKGKKQKANNVYCDAMCAKMLRMYGSFFKGKNTRKLST